MKPVSAPTDAPPKPLPLPRLAHSTPLAQPCPASCSFTFASAHVGARVDSCPTVTHNRHSKAQLLMKEKGSMEQKDTPGALQSSVSKAALLRAVQEDLCSLLFLSSCLSEPLHHYKSELTEFLQPHQHKICCLGAVLTSCCPSQGS